MAKRTIQIPFEDYYGYVDQQYPNQVYSVTQDGTYKITPYRISQYSESTQKERIFYLKIGALPEALKYQRLYDLQFVMQMYKKTPIDDDKEGVGCAFQTVLEFDRRTLTYNTKPSTPSYPAHSSAMSIRYADIIAAGGQDAWADVVGQLFDSSGNYPKLASYYTQGCLLARYFSLASGGFECNGSDYSMYVEVKPRLKNGTMPYVIVTYDDAETVTGKVELVDKITGQIDQGIDHTVTWEIKEKKYNETDWFCVANSWDQTSAVFYWREQGASAWNQIEIEDGTKEVTIPARTFGSNKSYEYYVEATDTAGGTSETATFTFTTPGSQITAQNSPTSGYVNPRNPITFGWSYSTGSGTVAGGATILHWREAETQAWTDVAAAADVYAITIPANTFSPAKAYEWYLSGSDTYGYASSTATYTFSTAAAAITSIPIEPINTIEDKNEIIHFAWSFVSNDGAPSSRSILQYKFSTDDTWTQIADLGAEVAEYDVPESTFDAGAIEWRVIPYNIDGIVGTSNSASFIAYGAPIRPTVFTDNAPFLTIMWQAEEQESFQIMVDEESYGPYFGTDKQFALPDYLEDGEHTVKVRTMGVYGLWSKWGETNVTIQNEPGEDVTLAAVSGLDIVLGWETEEETADFLIYRDGVLIGKTNVTEFKDRTVLGTYSYMVINRLPDGNYSVSNEAAATAMSDRPNIALLSGGDWVTIEYSKKGQKDPEYEDSTETTYSHLAGNTFPSVILSGFQDSNMSFSALFLQSQEEERKKFVSMYGQPIIMKMRDGTVFVGVLAGWTKSLRKNYWTSYEFTIRHIEWEDYRDDTQ